MARHGDEMHGVCCPSSATEEDLIYFVYEAKMDGRPKPEEYLPPHLHVSLACCKLSRASRESIYHTWSQKVSGRRCLGAVCHC